MPGPKSEDSELLPEKTLEEITEAATDRNLERLAGLIVGAAVAAAGAAAGMGPVAVIPATFSKKLTERIVGRLQADPSTLRMLEAGREIDERRARIAELTHSVVQALAAEFEKDRRLFGELSEQEEARFHQLILFFSRNLDALSSAQRETLAAVRAVEQRIGEIYARYQRAEAPIASLVHSEAFRTLVIDRTREFVGRDDILAEIENCAAGPEPRSGYIVIRGEPGIGKTALMAQLVARHGFTHHFNVAAQNIRSTREFLSNVCAQLIVRSSLAYSTLPPGALDNSAFLLKLLGEARAKEPNQRVVVLIDSLDEAEDAPPGVNRLSLPRTLPEGVVFVVTARPKDAERLLADHRVDLFLDDSDPSNLADVARYIELHIAEHPTEMHRRIAEWQVEPREFVDILVTLSEGNFMYLVHVMRDIRTGHLTHDTVQDVRQLPKGLRAYYHQHWQAMRGADPERFEKYYEPVLCFLATVREPVSLEQLENWTHLPRPRLKEVVNAWQNFLQQASSAQGAVLYRVYHASFAEFLRDEVGLERYHDAITSAALAKISGLDRGA